MISDLAPSIIKSLLRYNPETGLFLWEPRTADMFERPCTEKEVRRWNTRYAEQPALTTIGKKGYLYGEVWQRYCAAHRAAWVCFYGEWPVLQLDHWNTVTGDNRIENLRQATQSQNLMNRLPQRGTTRFCGITQLPSGNWAASITVDRNRSYIGTYNTPERAARAYDKAAIRLHGEFARINFPEGTAP